MVDYDVLVIGSGPAGNTAGIYTIRAGYKTAIVAGTSLGGQLTITTEVENFPGFSEPILGAELMDRMLKQAENLGVNIIYNNVVSVNFQKQPYSCKLENGEEVSAKNIVIATGAKTKWLGLESEKEFLGYGVSGCAVCDGGFFRNKIVAVIGGGDSAGIEALHLANLAKQVYIIYRKSEFSKMTKTLVDRISKNEKINSMFDSEIVEIFGQNNPKKVVGVKIINNKTKEISNLNLDGVFIAIGREPQSEIFKNTGININEDGYIITTSGSTRTSLKNVYACGDITNNRFKQAIIAAADGCVAGLEIQEDN